MTVFKEWMSLRRQTQVQVRWENSEQKRREERKEKRKEERKKGGNSTDNCLGNTSVVAPQNAPSAAEVPQDSKCLQAGPPKPAGSPPLWAQGWPLPSKDAEGPQQVCLLHEPTPFPSAAAGTGMVTAWSLDTNPISGMRDALLQPQEEEDEEGGPL